MDESNENDLERENCLSFQFFHIHRCLNAHRQQFYITIIILKEGKKVLQEWKKDKQRKSDDCCVFALKS